MSSDIIPDKKPQILLARMLVAAIPGVGGSASIYLDSKIKKRKEELLIEYFEDIKRRIETLEEKFFPDDRSIELGNEAVTASIETWRPQFFAALVANKPSDIDTFVRHALIRSAKDLNEIEICVLTSLSIDRPDLSIIQSFSSLRNMISKLEEESNEVSSIREIAINKLHSNGLLKTNSSEVNISKLGELLLEIISE